MSARVTLASLLACLVGALTVTLWQACGEPARVVSIEAQVPPPKGCDCSRCAATRAEWIDDAALLTCPKPCDLSAIRRCFTSTTASLAEVCRR